MKYWVVMEGAVEVEADNEEDACVQAMNDIEFNYTVTEED